MPALLDCSSPGENPQPIQTSPKPRRLHSHPAKSCAARHASHPTRPLPGDSVHHRDAPHNEYRHFPFKPLSNADIQTLIRAHPNTTEKHLAEAPENRNCGRQ
ncbi:hypothetical protein OF001_U310017 [Pseudomonas sp. OF001]|nr:hypothetical protein OF001_U310017 [Pseudomonas sp. OF001]